MAASEFGEVDLSQASERGSSDLSKVSAIGAARVSRLRSSIGSELRVTGGSDILVLLRW